ncbi:MAG: glycoside hydrolase family 3 C-terminal domain-containing protein, partial [Actinobacteria bacterium]|nr:glycoside hydrolase family 3 C-terminal domain-containing protein [Actinomycetota bacterium]
GSGSFELSVDGTVMASPVIPEPDRDPLSPLVEPGEHRLEIASGRHELVLGLRWDPDADWHILGLGHETPGPDAESLLAAAETAAREAEAVVLVVGTTAEYETEGIDRQSLALPGAQDELIRRVCAANPRTVLVLNTGSPVLMPWAELPAAVLWAGFPGQEGGEAIADLLLGVEEPGGRLSMTVPAVETELPSLIPVDGTLVFAEEERIGYRSRLPTTFPFGHGLGYTDWAYAHAAAELDDDGARVTVQLRNAGGRHGREVVQLYLRDGDGDSNNRSDGTGAALRLVGFADCTADPGESVELRIRIHARELREWRASGWRRRSGPLRLEIGRSSADLRLSVELRLPDAAHHSVPAR